MRRETFDGLALRRRDRDLAESAATGDVAQLGEHRLCKPGVTGSSPVVSTNDLRSVVRNKLWLLEGLGVMYGKCVVLAPSFLIVACAP